MLWSNDSVLVYISRELAMKSPRASPNKQRDEKDECHKQGRYYTKNKLNPCNKTYNSMLKKFFLHLFKAIVFILAYK